MSFFENSTPQEEAAMQAHFTYLKQASAMGVVLLAGPCLDETFGIVIFQAQDETTARGFMQSDPAVKSNVMLSELHPMKVSMMSPVVRK
jgi:uncharacterized protein YciI